MSTQPDEPDRRAVAQPPQYGPYGQPLGPSSPYDPHGQQSYGQQSYGQSYGQPYGQPPGYGGPLGPSPAYPDSAPARPGGVITTAVFGFIFSALGVLLATGLIIAAGYVRRIVDQIEESDGTISGLDSSDVDALRAVLVGGGIVVLAWAAFTCLAAVLALTGRSRVPMIVTTAFGVALWGLGLIGTLPAVGEDGGAASAAFVLAGLALCVTMIVLVSVRPATEFYAASRTRRRR